MALELFVTESFTAGGVAICNPRWDEPTVVLHDVENGNIDSALVVITDVLSGTPVIEVDRHTGAGSLWRHFMFGVSGVEGKKPRFEINRATKSGASTISPTYEPVSTVDFSTWISPGTVDFIGGSSGTIEWEFDTPLPAGITYLSSNPTGRLQEATALAADLIANYPSVAAPTTSADAGGVYATTPAETNHNSVAVGGNDQYSFKLAFGGATTDGQPKRKAVFLYGIHAAGESQSWLPFYNSVKWILDSALPEAVNFRANWDVYLYFVVNANGLKGGNFRTAFRNNQDFNRDFLLTGSSVMQEITDLRAAIELDTGTDAELLVSWHGDTFNIDPLIFAVNPDDELVPRQAALQAIIDEAEALSGEVAEVNGAGVTTTDTYWGFSKLGTKASFDQENPSSGPDTSPAHWLSIADTIMKSVSVADQAGLFNDVALSIGGKASSISALQFAGSVSQGVGIDGNAGLINVTGILGSISQTTDISINSTSANLTINSSKALALQDTVLNGTHTIVSAIEFPGIVSQAISLNGGLGSIEALSARGSLLQESILSSVPSAINIEGILGEINLTSDISIDATIANLNAISALAFLSQQVVLSAIPESINIDGTVSEVNQGTGIDGAYGLISTVAIPGEVGLIGTPDMLLSGTPTALTVKEVTGSVVGAGIIPANIVIHGMTVEII